MEFVIDYGVFAAKFLTVAVVIVAAIGVLIALVASRAQGPREDYIDVTKLNDKYAAMRRSLHAAMLPARELKAEAKREKQAQKARAKAAGTDSPRRRVFVVRFDGDLRASGVESLQEEITAILSVAEDKDEVVVQITSPGGVIHGYGLAASQLGRVRERGITLTAAIDKVAASGGYMMACVAQRIIAAPFAVVGSIGVVAQLPNFHRLLKKHDIDYEEITAGQYKRTLTMFGENTDADREKFREEIADAHELFKEFVAQNRPRVDIGAIATGEYWYGKRALERGLVDDLATADDYLYRLSESADIFAVTHRRKRSLMERFMQQARAHLVPL